MRTGCMCNPVHMDPVHMDPVHVEYNFQYGYSNIYAVCT